MIIKTYDNQINWNDIEKLEIKKCSFSNNPSPKTFAKIAYSKTLGIQVLMKSLRLPERITFVNNDDPVWQDTCLECFLSFDNVKYINIETNANCASFMSIGKDRYDRTSLFAINDMHLPVVKTNILDNGWTASFTIPNETIKELYGLTILPNTPVYINLYCCGDLTPNPYYGALNEPISEIPDFHQIAYFIKMTIE